ncbi:hypothetical protein PtA15_4A2 [Puccinia triticina]|uniref:Uncharacterized protein n=1 Tax=Puccinia triticina TaxID=208348 RepID=A0ABY7CES5_9BASI|nr:uncharacterized protein PtA15_4A2 [Puccinia triticina]WAQ83554.1 hypothetical protein PtA15_4A2 [Puccinia triticina]WAR54386.1 hypothetical protein PtB15_4B3 [Puccinia triticina]
MLSTPPIPRFSLRVVADKTWELSDLSASVLRGRPAGQPKIPNPQIAKAIHHRASHSSADRYHHRLPHKPIQESSQQATSTH